MIGLERCASHVLLGLENVATDTVRACCAASSVVILTKEMNQLKYLFRRENILRLQFWFDWSKKYR
jgi:hypothetical protein